MKNIYMIALVAIMASTLFFSQAVLAATINIKAVHDNEEKGILKVCVENKKSGYYSKVCKYLYTNTDVDYVKITINANKGDSLYATGQINGYYGGTGFNYSGGTPTVEVCITC